MKDAFGNKIDVGTRVVYSVHGSAGTVYIIGEITKLHPYVKSNKSYTPPDRVQVKPLKASNKNFQPTKEPIVYASNVVRWTD